jgi:hypothetical protein
MAEGGGAGRAVMGLESGVESKGKSSVEDGKASGIGGRFSIKDGKGSGVTGTFPNIPLSARWTDGWGDRPRDERGERGVRGVRPGVVS